MRILGIIIKDGILMQCRVLKISSINGKCFSRVTNYINVMIILHFWYFSEFFKFLVYFSQFIISITMNVIFFTKFIITSILVVMFSDQKVLKVYGYTIHSMVIVWIKFSKKILQHHLLVYFFNYDVRAMSMLSYIMYNFLICLKNIF